ncbi:rhomboid family intramembrane serine protease [Chitinophagaceae bacterium MMS25-I14]
MTEFRPGRFQVLPPVVKNIIIINVIMVLAQFVLGQTLHIDLANYLGLHYWKSYYWGVWQPLTHIFMHGSYNDFQGTLLHIFSNMFALWMFGSILENLWGSKRFLIFYLICGLGAAFCHLMVLHYEFSIVEKAFQAYQHNATLDQFIHFIKENITNGVEDPGKVNTLLSNWQQDPGNLTYRNESINWIYEYIHGATHGSFHIKGIYDEATVGASGAVFGVLFAFGYLFPNTLLYLYFFVPIKAKWFVAGYALFELYSGVQNSAGDNVAHFAHLGGMLFAFILLKIWGRTVRNRFY